MKRLLSLLVVAALAVTVPAEATAAPKKKEVPKHIEFEVEVYSGDEYITSLMVEKYDYDLEWALYRDYRFITSQDSLGHPRIIGIDCEVDDTGYMLIDSEASWFLCEPDGTLLETWKEVDVDETTVLCAVLAP